MREVPGSQLSVLALTGMLFGNLEGEDIMFLRDSTALLSLGDPFQVQAAPCSGGSLRSPLLWWLQKLVSVFGSLHK